MFAAMPKATIRDQLESLPGRPYAVERELRGGGMSRTFVADERALGRRVVIKVLDPELFAGISAERFLREIRTTAQLQHPTIVPVLSTGEVGGFPFYTMPYVEGASLRERLDRGPLPEREAISVLRDVARALAHAHEHGVVHRDVKPDNVLLAGDAGVVTDFGIAKALDASRTAGQTLTAIGVAVGTPAYIAPEQATGDAVDARADIYAWGVLAYEVLTGAHPFAGKKTAQQLIAAHVSEAPPPMRTSPLAPLVMRCLEKDPARRPYSAREIAEELEAVRSGERRTHVPRGRRALLAGAIVAATAAAAWGLIAVNRRAASAAVDPGVVAVLPFRVAASDPSLHYLREGVLDLLAAQLVGVPRTADTRAVLAAWRKAGATDLIRDDAVGLAESIGAGRVLQGDVVGPPDRVTITATLYAVPGGRETARASATGAAAAFPILLDSIVRRLLALDAGEGEVRAAALADIPIGALRAYLAGQAAYRRGQYDDAMGEYLRAIEIDSTFALAGLALWQASGWTLARGGDRGRAIAQRYVAALGTRDRLILGEADPAREPTTDAERLAERERAVEAVPDSPELWYRLGDYHTHYGAALVGEAESHRRAIAAFERGLAIDSSFSPLLEHLPMLYQLTGDSARMRAAYGRLTRDTTAFYHNAVRLIHSPDAAERAEALTALERGHSIPAGYATAIACTAGESLEHVPRLLAAGRRNAATDDARHAMQLFEYFYLMNSGQPSRAARLAAEIPTRRDDHMYAWVFWHGDSALAARQYAERLPAVLGGPGERRGSERAAWVTLAYDVASYELAVARPVNVDRILALLRNVPAGDAQPTERARPARLALVLEAQRNPAALPHLDSLMALGPLGPRVAATGNLVLARLHERAGRLEEAYTALQRWAVTSVTTATLHSTYLLERGRVAAALGRRDDALRAYRHFLAYQQAAEPSSRREVERIRAEAARLENAGR